MYSSNANSSSRSINEMKFNQEKIICKKAELQSSIIKWISSFNILHIQVFERFIESFGIQLPVELEPIGHMLFNSECSSFYYRNNLEMPFFFKDTQLDVIMFNFTDSMGKKGIIGLHSIQSRLKTAQISIIINNQLTTYYCQLINGQLTTTKKIVEQERYTYNDLRVFKMTYTNSRIINITFEDGECLNVVINSKLVSLENFNLVEAYIIGMKKPIILDQIFKEIIKLMNFSINDFEHIDSFMLSYCDKNSRVLNKIFMLNDEVKDFGLYVDGQYLQMSEKGKCIYTFNGNTIEYNIESNSGNISFNNLDSSFISAIPSILPFIREKSIYLDSMFEVPFNPLNIQ